MKELLTYILSSITDAPFEIEEEESDGFITYTVKAPQDVIGKIIGKNGKTIHSIKNLLKIKAIKEQKKVEIRVVEL